MKTLNNEIKSWLSKYLSGEITLQEFEVFFAQASWNVHKSNDLGTIGLVGEVELRLAEYTSGHRTEEEVRRYFEEILSRSISEPNSSPLVPSLNANSPIFTFQVVYTSAEPAALLQQGVFFREIDQRQIGSLR